MRQLKIGTCQTELTPPMPVMLGGMFKKYQADQVLDPLYASCVVLDDGTAAAVIVSCDLAIIQRDTVTYIRDQIQQKTGIPGAHICISTTHTHTAPNMGLESIYSSADESSILRVADLIVASVVSASEKMVPARMGFGKGHVNRCASNRRYIMSNGRSKMNPVGVNNPDRLLVEGPADEELQVAWFEDLEGNLLSVLVNFASHAAIYYGRKWISADFPGVIRSVIQKVYGSHLPVLYLQGACGNTIPFDFEHDDNWGRGIDGCRRIGTILAGETIKIMAENPPDENAPGNVKILGKTLALPFREYSAVEVADAKAFWNQLPPEQKEKLDAFALVGDLEKAAQINNIFVLDQLKQQYGRMPVEIMAIGLGNLVIVTNPAELFVEYQLQIKQHFRDTPVMVVELANGWISYVPTRQAIALGGYEVSQRRVCDEAGQLITDASIDLVRQLTMATRTFPL
ncbi:MAG: hypothetical protein SCM11_19270 [Bacillota bacterium]|nr:hypothetical protein [Bacillota bacterium]